MIQRSWPSLLSLAGGITGVAASAFFVAILVIGRSQVRSPAWVFASVIVVASIAGLLGAIFSLRGSPRRAGLLLWAAGGALVPGAALSVVAAVPIYLVLAVSSLLLLAGATLAERSMEGRGFLWRWAIYLVLIVGLLFFVTGVYA